MLAGALAGPAAEVNFDFAAGCFAAAFCLDASTCLSTGFLAVVFFSIGFFSTLCAASLTEDCLGSVAAFARLAGAFALPDAVAVALALLFTLAAVRAVAALALVRVAALEDALGAARAFADFRSAAAGVLTLLVRAAAALAFAAFSFPDLVDVFLAVFLAVSAVAVFFVRLVVAVRDLDWRALEELRVVVRADFLVDAIRLNSLFTPRWRRGLRFPDKSPQYFSTCAATRQHSGLFSVDWGYHRAGQRTLAKKYRREIAVGQQSGIEDTLTPSSGRWA